MANTRRQFLKQGVNIAALSAVGLSTTACVRQGAGPETQRSKKSGWPIAEGPGTPKICTGISSNADAGMMRRMKQIGVDNVLMGGPAIPWTENDLRTIVDRFQSEGLTVINMMIGGFPNVIYGREGRDQEIENIQKSLQAAGAVGLPVVEYNFYAHRLMEGYHEVAGRGGAGYTGFDYAHVKDLPADPVEGSHRAGKLWNNLTYFLEAVIPVAEKAGVRMALHPNDPPVPISHGSDQIMRSFDNWKLLLDIVDSPSNGMTFDCGVTRETGADPVEVCRYLGERDRINHVHFRNVQVESPFVKYTEVFPDSGLVNMFAVMRELVRLGYTHGIYPEHERALDYDRQAGMKPYYPGGGGYAGLTYNVAYARAMLQAALSIKNM
jgi:mannonate dehydratase